MLSNKFVYRLVSVSVHYNPLHSLPYIYTSPPFLSISYLHSNQRYIDMIEFEINSIPEPTADGPEPDFEPIFLQLKTIVTSAKRQLGRQEIDNHEKEERTLNLDAANIPALPDLPSETPLSRAVSPPFPSLDASSFEVVQSPFPDFTPYESSNDILALSPSPSLFLCDYPSFR